MTPALPSWADGPARDRIIDFVRRVTDEASSAHVPPAGRIAVFDNDGTLWCEKPGPIQAEFLFHRLARMAAREPALVVRQPWKAALARDHAWLGAAIEQHYRGDGAALHAMVDGLLQCYVGLSTDEFARAAADFLHVARHPQLGRPYVECTYTPMTELLRYLAGHGFTNCIASGGTRDFMRTVTEEVYGIQPENVIGSSVALEYREDVGDIVHTVAVEVFDDGPMKPVRIWSRLGRRPIFAAGNANGDIQMLDYCARGPGASMCLLIHHDDAAREYAYTGGAEAALLRAARDGWTVAAMAGAWRTVFAPPAGAL
ncbi:phosphoglycolate phosphatase-like HAD superfamily hydrolase [Massilia sp. UYP11]|uniref:HAD family hydrolase n=1 Tax=Massilia sp. UYP11 TaxID=1756385 RepID=UPI003D25F92C